MNKESLNLSYFSWLCKIVYDDRYFKHLSYKRLLEKLYNTEFSYINIMDSNRSEDGIDLRYRFGSEHKIDDYEIDLYLNDRPCSILEMMVALSLRCEEHIMSDSDIGNRTSQWFWNMLVNLGLGKMDDDHYDIYEVELIIDIFLNREYEPNGKGGLFTVYNSPEDMRKIDIWYQMCRYLLENEL